MANANRGSAREVAPSPSEAQAYRFVSPLTARMILEAGAVRHSAEQPYFLSSGWASPVYIDVQRLISFPRIRASLMDMATELLLAQAGFESFDAVAGVEPSGIAYAAWIAERLSLPLQYVRRKGRGFGPQARLEGALRPGARVLVVDDVTTDGRTKVDVCRSLREMGARADHVLVLFFFDVFPGARELLARENIRLHHLATWRDVLAAARQGGAFAEDAVRDVERFLADPARWSIEHGGVGAMPGEPPG